MLQLFKISPIKTGTTKYTPAEMVAKFVSTINSNSSVFTAEINSSSAFLFSVISKNISMESLGFQGTANILDDSGYTVAIDDEKEFLLIIVGSVQNSCGNISTIINGFNSGSVNPKPYNTVICVTGKDLNGNCFCLPIQGSTQFYHSLTSIFDVGARATDSYDVTGDYYIRQGAIYNYIVPEIFISMNRLGHTGQIIEKDGSQYVCLGGMIFYKI